MINKLRKRILLVIMLSLSVVILGIIILFAILNYNNIINNGSFMMDKFGGDPGANADIGNNAPETTENTVDNLTTDEPPQAPEDTDNSNSETTGIYNVLVSNGEVIPNKNETVDETIKEYALEVSKKSSEKGIIGNYIYNSRKEKEGSCLITLMENESAIKQAKETIAISIALSIFALIIIYIIANKVSKMMVKPVEETFTKQKQFISDASHELKTPLAVVEANADVLENELPNNKWLRIYSK